MSILEEKAELLVEAWRAIGPDHANAKLAEMAKTATDWEIRAIRDAFQRKLKELTAPKRVNTCLHARVDPASIAVFPDGHRPAVARATCDGTLEWENVQGLLVTRAINPRARVPARYYHARCPACGTETRQQAAPRPGQLCDNPTEAKPQKAT